MSGLLGPQSGPNCSQSPGNLLIAFIPPCMYGASRQRLFLPGLESTQMSSMIPTSPLRRCRPLQACSLWTYPWNGTRGQEWFPRAQEQQCLMFDSSRYSNQHLSQQQKPLASQWSPMEVCASNKHDRNHAVQSTSVWSLSDGIPEEPSLAETYYTQVQTHSSGLRDMELLVSSTMIHIPSWLLASTCILACSMVQIFLASTE